MTHRGKYIGGNNFVFEVGHSVDEWQEKYGNTELRDFLAIDVVTWSIEANPDIVYWWIGDRLYETNQSPYSEQVRAEGRTDFKSCLTPCDLANILRAMADYVVGCDDVNLDIRNANGYFKEIVQSGLFHDAIGKVVTHGVTDSEQLIANLIFVGVTTEY